MSQKQAKRLRRMEREITNLHSVQNQTVLLVCDIVRQLPGRTAFCQRISQWLKR